MSGIYIKGMEMPKSCSNCAFCHHSLTENSYCTASQQIIDYFMRKKSRLDNCPLIAVPDHGDLIDRDETMNVILEEQGEDYPAWYAGIVNEMPTIIPAEEGKTW